MLTTLAPPCKDLNYVNLTLLFGSFKLHSDAAFRSSDKLFINTYFGLLFYLTIHNKKQKPVSDVNVQTAASQYVFINKGVTVSSRACKSNSADTALSIANTTGWNTAKWQKEKRKFRHARGIKWAGIAQSV
jgi:hypothetical protein